MSKLCKESRHRWKDDGEPSYVAEMLTQPQTCTRCSATRGYVASMSSDERPTLARLIPHAVALVVLAGILYLYLRQ